MLVIFSDFSQFWCDCLVGNEADSEGISWPVNRYNWAQGIVTWRHPISSKRRTKAWNVTNNQVNIWNWLKFLAKFHVQ